MKYKNIKKATFVSRPNRFIAKVSIDGKEETVHVKNTGRCKELLVPGTEVWLEEVQNPLRKTKYDLVTVLKKSGDGKRLMINMDSQVVNSVAEEWLRAIMPQADIRREVTYGNSRFDLKIVTPESSAFVEVKGVTLEKDGVAMFPDAPTKRGVKHLYELIKARKEGFDCGVLFVIQMKGVSEFRPNAETDPDFAEALKAAKKAGVHIAAAECKVTEEEIFITNLVPKITI